MSRRSVNMPSTLPNVAYVANNLFTCSQDTQQLIREAIKEHRLNRVVVAACTPRTHEPLFQETIREAGLNRYLFELANIRDQDSWVHQAEPEKATEKAKDLVRMAVAKVALLEPIERIQVDLFHEALVIGGGVAGMNAALNLADQGFKTYLVEEKQELGGHALKVKQSWKGEDVGKYVMDLRQRVQDHANVEVLTGAQVIRSSRFCRQFFHHGANQWLRARIAARCRDPRDRGAFAEARRISVRSERSSDALA